MYLLTKQLFSFTGWSLAVAVVIGICVPCQAQLDVTDSEAAIASKTVHTGVLPSAAPGDIVKVDVYDEPSISGVFSVNASGDILYPLIGRIAVAGSDSAGIGIQIEQLLEADYIRDANVSISITKTEVSTGNVLVFGGVRTPGQVAYPKEVPIELIKAITESGGFTEHAIRDSIEIQRADESGLTTHRVNLAANESFQLKNGDVVVVKEKVVAPIIATPVRKAVGHVIVIGQVTRPGKVEVDLGQPTSLVTAIAMAGDFTRLARKSKVTITRRVDPHGGKKAFTVDVGDIINGKANPFQVYPGDTIYVPETRF